MDIFTIRRRLNNLDQKMNVPCIPCANTPEEKEDRINDIVKKVNAKKPIKNKWGGKDYPIDVNDYGQFMSALQSLSWILRDMGYDSIWLTKGGLHYSSEQYYGYPQLFDRATEKVAALVAVGKNGNCYRFTRDDKTLRIRGFSSTTRAIAPVSDKNSAGSRPFNSSAVKQLVNIMKTQSNLNPEDPLSLRRWGRVVQNKSLAAIGGGPLKNQLKIVFKQAKVI